MFRMLEFLRQRLAALMRPEAPLEYPQLSSRDWADLPVYHPQCDSAPF